MNTAAAKCSNAKTAHPTQAACHVLLAFTSHHPQAIPLAKAVKVAARRASTQATAPNVSDSITLMRILAVCLAEGTACNVRIR